MRLRERRNPTDSGSAFRLTLPSSLSRPAPFLYREFSTSNFEVAKAQYLHAISPACSSCPTRSIYLPRPDRSQRRRPRSPVVGGRRSLRGWWHEEHWPIQRRPALWMDPYRAASSRLSPRTLCVPPRRPPPLSPPPARHSLL